MPEETGRRERKKQQTRRTLIETAARLFAERGYEATGVADIAEAADVSKRTFFLHFPTKEDVLISDGRARLDLALRVIEEREPGAPLREVLARSLTAMIDDTAARDLPSGMAALRARLIADSPTVQARILHAAFNAQARIAEALREAYPEVLDRTTAPSIVGAVVGAVSAAAIASLQDGDSAAETTAAMRRAAVVGLSALDALEE
ncbi:TetR/AcrR family transcriptional regulator [Glycomyces terrestris]|uniref:TetR family transcriptional regulator n=1 Tax=Glycomyces terrestris TaxID=2493553 RepID=A0A426UTG2_9ACTN|nr:TetR/AcrR family transcriptional regulator [Glycomyces terrestris]RRR96835.1 TetR family transcriptional regulator [Glycomyces terrestris]